MGGTALAAAAEVLPATDWMIRYREVEGCERQGPLSRCWGVRFEDVEPVRAFPSYRGQRNFPGLWWAATMGGHVGFESWLERDQVMVLDFDPEVVAFASQPFWLCWARMPSGRVGMRRTSSPGCRDGTGVVIDVRADDRIGRDDAEAFAVTARGVRGGGLGLPAGGCGRHRCWRRICAGWPVTGIRRACTRIGRAGSGTFRAAGAR